MLRGEGRASGAAATDVVVVAECHVDHVMTLVLRGGGSFLYSFGVVPFWCCPKHSVHNFLSNRMYYIHP